LQYGYQRTNEQTQTLSCQFIIHGFHRIAQTFPNRWPLENGPNRRKNAPNEVKFAKKIGFLVKNRQKTQKSGTKVNSHPNCWIGIVILQSSE
jgi:hypothetical protein